MPARRKQALLFGGADESTIWHRENRSKKGREKRKTEEQKSITLLRKLKKLEKYEKTNPLESVQ